MGTGDRAARSASAAITVSTPAVIPLENGDRLSRRENGRSPLIGRINPSNRSSKAHSCSS